MSLKKWIPTIVVAVAVIAAIALFTFMDPHFQTLFFSLICILMAIFVINTLTKQKVLPQSTSTSNKTQNKKILLVDDSPANRRIIMEILKILPVDVTEADNGTNALTLYEEYNNFHVVLMDLEMEELSGFDAAKRIRELEDRQKRIPLIAISAHSSNEKKIEALTSGFDEYLSKPVDNDHLIYSLQRWLNLTNESDSLEPKIIPANDPIKELQSMNIEPQDTYAKLINKKTSATLEFIKDKSTDNSATIKKVVDVKQSLIFSRNNHELAKDMLSMLIDLIKDKRDTVNQLFVDKDWQALGQLVHKINGGSCYCGVPELQQQTQIIDKALENKDIDTVNTHFPAFLDAVDDLIEWDEEHDMDIIFEG